MVTDLVVGVLIDFLTGVLSLLPAYQLPGAFVDFAPTIAEKLDAVNGVFPVVTLGQALIATVGFRVFLAGWGLVVWLYDKIPFKAT